MIPTNSVDKKKLRQVAYRLADETGERVYIIDNPAEKQDYYGRTGSYYTPYCITHSMADEWERSNGELVTPREV